jgi:hypothetical protein
MSYILKYLRFKRIVEDIVENENLLYNLSNLFGTEFRIDKIGRIYTILNPYIKNGKFTRENQILEYTEGGVKDTSSMEKWIMDRMIVANEFIINNQLFDIMTYNITKLDDYANYRIVLEPVYYKNFMKELKISGIVLFILGLLGILTLLFI